PGAHAPPAATLALIVAGCDTALSDPGLFLNSTTLYLRGEEPLALRMSTREGSTSNFHASRERSSFPWSSCPRVTVHSMSPLSLTCEGEIVVCEEISSSSRAHRSPSRAVSPGSVSRAARPCHQAIPSPAAMVIDAAMM